MGWTKDDSVQRDGVTPKEASRAWHQAREDAAGSGSLPERNENKTSDSESGGLLNFLFRIAEFGRNDSD